MAKHLVSGPILTQLAQIRPSNFFSSKIWLHQSLDIMVIYHHVQYQKKLMIQSWENLVMDGRTDRQRDKQTGESDFIGRCPTNVERPIGKTEIFAFIALLVFKLLSREVLFINRKGNRYC